jgi:TIR domain-containing protein/uncharacterized protein DUF4255
VVATIFLSYRRTDSPQACRVHDWLAQRFGLDALFMDVQAIPVAVSFPDYIRQAIENSRLVIALIGARWLEKIHEVDDPVRLEIEAAIANRITVLPVLIGSTPMPDADELPKSIATLAAQNAATLGVSFDFNSHMLMLLTRIEAILGVLAKTSVVASDPFVIQRASQAVVRFLQEESTKQQLFVQWNLAGSNDFSGGYQNGATVYLHRVARLAEVVDLHLLVSFWTNASDQQALTGFVMRLFEESPVIPDSLLSDTGAADFYVKLRWSDEDPRQVWKMITDERLRLSLACVATLAPKGARR